MSPSSSVPTSLASAPGMRWRSSPPGSCATSPGSPPPRQAEAEDSQGVAAEREREAEIAQQREITHREIHDHLLPIVDTVSSGAPISEHLARLAGHKAARARRLIIDPRVESSPGFEALMTDVRDTYMDA